LDAVSVTQQSFREVKDEFSFNGSFLGVGIVGDRLFTGQMLPSQQQESSEGCIVYVFYL